MLNVVIFGGPGSGKGTQSAVITEKYNLKHLSTGDLLRAEMAAGTELGRIARSYTDAGNLVPDEMIVRILAKAMDGIGESQGVIFDGFPRNVAQAAVLDERLDRRGEKVTVLLDLVVPDETLVERMLFRSQISGRADDNPETIKNRVKVYHQVTSPVVDYYRKKGVCVEIDGTGSIEQTSALVIDALDKLV